MSRHAHILQINFSARLLLLMYWRKKYDWNYNSSTEWPFGPEESSDRFCNKWCFKPRLQFEPLKERQKHWKWNEKTFHATAITQMVHIPQFLMNISDKLMKWTEMDHLCERRRRSNRNCVISRKHQMWLHF